MMKRAFFLMLLLSGFACATDRAQDRQTAATPASRYTSEAGDIPVGVIPIAALRDAQRQKDLELNIEYPTRGGPNPVIIFSHGFGTSGRSYVGLSSFWTSHGFVVIKPTHADAGQFREDEDFKDAWAKTTPADWRNRVDDIKLIIDSFDKLVEQYPELQGKMDSSRIGVGGHSYGAFTAVLIAGAKTVIGGVTTSYADPRVKAVVAMSPQGVSESRGLTRDSWTDLRVPVLYMTGTDDRGLEGEDPEWRHQAFEFSPPGDKWFVSVAGATHFSFAGRFGALPRELPTGLPPPELPPTDPRSRRPTIPQPAQPRVAPGAFLQERNIFGTIRAVSLAFWDAYLMTQPAGREYLSGLSGRGDLEVESK